MIKVFYDKRQSVRSNDSFSPSAGKPELLAEVWRKSKKVTFESFEPSSIEDLCLVHDQDYVNGVLSCQIPNGFGNKSLEIAQALPWVSGSMVAAALEAYREDSFTFSLTSGAHHAHYASGGAFCTFNFLVLAALKAHQAGAKRVGIIDLDRHPSDGVRDIASKLGMDFLQVYSFGEQEIDCAEEAKEWLEKLPVEIFKFEGCDLLLYNAGVDVFIDDPMGGLLDAEEIARRDHCVYDIAQTICPAVATSLAGGYYRDEDGGIGTVLGLHTLALSQAYRTLPVTESDDSQN